MKVKGRLIDNIKISQMVSTVILVTTVFSIISFGLIFHMYYNADAKNSAALSSSFEAIGGLFGGITTLAAAYIASQFFNDWKIQHNKTMEVQLALRMLEKFEFFDDYICSVYSPIKTAFDLKNDEIIEKSVNTLKEEGHEKMMQIFLNYLTLSISIEHYSLLKNTKEEHAKVIIDLRHSRIAFRKYTDSCISLDNDLHYSSYAKKILDASEIILPHIDGIEEKYILNALTNLKA